MKRKDRKIKIFLMLALILCITIGYATLTTTLNITGNSEIKNAKWDIHFANLVVDDTSVEAPTPAAIDANKTTVNYVVDLAKPGDSYSFTVDVENAGTIDGMISTISNTGLITEQQYLDYSIMYSNGVELKQKDGLRAGTKRTIKVSVKYKDNINYEDLPQEDKNINVNFTVEYVQADDTVIPPTPIMKAYTSSSTDDYHNSTYKSKVTKIVTKTNIDVPATAIEHWDVSEAGDGSVVAYIEDDGSGKGTYQVTIGGDGGKIFANEDSSNLFCAFSSLKEADLSSFDTSNVTNMYSMFYSCIKLTILDLSSFNTGKVTDMNGMFYKCISLTNLDLSSFNTSNVTNMWSMFYFCIKLKSLNLSSFDTSKVTNMYSMFYNCSNLTTVITIKNSNVSNYSGMFDSAATEAGAQITVNYTSATSDLVDQMIATKASTSNVAKGSLVS